MIHSSAIVSKHAQIGDNVEIGPYSIIHDNVVLYDNVRIGSHCEIGLPVAGLEESPLIIKNNANIRSHSVFYTASIFDEGLVTGHRVTVREKTIAGKGFQCGTLSDIQGDCIIGDYVKTHSNVHIGQKTTIEDYVWIFPYTVITNDPHPPSNTLIGCTIKKYAVVATMSVILPGKTIGEGALIAAHSSVNRDIPNDVIAAGSPAKIIAPTNKIKLTSDAEESAYPWRKHFHRGYPKEVVEEWIREFS